MTLPHIMAGSVEAIIVTTGMRELPTATLEFVFAGACLKVFIWRLWRSSKLLSWVMEIQQTAFLGY